jgi:histone-binding protein RBBP4
MATGFATAPEHEIDENKRINELYKIWKKNSPMMYEYIYSRAMYWPTLTTQWFPDVKE